MKTRRLVLIFGIVFVMLMGAAATAYTLTARDGEKPQSIKPKNDLVFNWGSSS